MSINSITNETDRLRVELVRARRLSVFLGFSLLVALGAVFKVSGSHTTTIVPPSIKETFWVSQDRVSAPYLQQMASYVIGLSENFTPKNIEYKHNQILEITDPRIYSGLRTSLMDKAEHVKRNDISSVFHESAVVVDEEKMLVKITGQLSVFIGKELSKPTIKHFLIAFDYGNGHITVKSIKEVTQ